MTTTPIYPHGIGLLPAPCWTIELVKPGPDDEPDIGHWLTRDAAEKILPRYATEEHPAGDWRVVQEEFRCTTVILLCGEQFEYEGDQTETHFVDEPNAVASMELARVVQVGPGLFAEPMHCEACDDAIANRPEPVAEIPGQTQIGGF